MLYYADEKQSSILHMNYHHRTSEGEMRGNISDDESEEETSSNDEEDDDDEEKQRSQSRFASSTSILLTHTFLFMVCMIQAPFQSKPIIFSSIYYFHAIMFLFHVLLLQ